MIKVALAAFLSSAVGGLAKRVLISLGFGIISIAGVSVALNNMLDLARNNYASLGGYMASFSGLAGIGEAFGIIAGAMVFRVAMMATSKLALIPK